MREVLERLRELAKREADLLFGEMQALRTRASHSGGPTLPELCERLSVVFNTVKDATVLDIQEASPASLTNVERYDILAAHVPACLMAQDAQARLAQLPPAYEARILATVLTSHLVYGVGVVAFEDMLGRKQEAFRGLAIDYWRASHAMAAGLVAHPELLREAVPKAVLYDWRMRAARSK